MFKKKTEAGKPTGYPGIGKAAENTRDSAEITESMDAKGEAVAESLGNATIDNKYNSSM